jgi:hypothetical protein
MTEQSEKKFEINSFVSLENVQEHIDKAGLSENQLKDFYENLQGFFVDESEKIVEEFFDFFHSGEYILPVGNFCYRYDNGEIVRFFDNDIILPSFVKPNNAIEVVVPFNLEHKINFENFQEDENEIVNQTAGIDELPGDLFFHQRSRLKIQHVDLPVSLRCRSPSHRRQRSRRPPTPSRRPPAWGRRPPSFTESERRGIFAGSRVARVSVAHKFNANRERVAAATVDTHCLAEPEARAPRALASAVSHFCHRA